LNIFLQELFSFVLRIIINH